MLPRVGGTNTSPKWWPPAARLAACRQAGHDVYDFRDPVAGAPFRWSDVDENWQQWNAATYRNKLQSHDLCQRGFGQDMGGMEWSDICLLVMPAGRSAHLELGWCAGRGKTTVIYYPDGISIEPELMAKMADHILVGSEEFDAYLWNPRGCEDE